MTGTGAQADSKWDLITQVFEEALDLPPADRLKFVRERCAGQTDVISEINGLLEAHEASGEFLMEIDSIQALALLEDDETGDLPRAGPFRLIREIGRGGMGIVYLGERSDGQFDRMVAVKVVKRGMDSEAIKTRFLRERQILAGLEHPHIARLYDGGITEDGQPYFAMEYVDGLPLTEYCDRHRLPLEKRIELFEQACGAVQYAHRNLVIHRDLKPSNMLVTEDGGLKLLDFGIAKVVNEESSEQMKTITAFGQRVLTPEYASPEQLRADTITTASDVYSLGVVLYELLSGYRPYSIGNRTPAEIERSIVDSKIPAPSTLISSPERLGNEARASDVADWQEIAARRSIPLLRLRRRLRGDLDTIVLKALRKDPDRRYASVEAFLEDLRRHASGLPIEARPESVTYRTRKFVERHIVGVSVAALVAILLVGALAVSLNLAEQKAQESLKAKQVTAFLASMFSSSDPDRTKGIEITVLEVMDQGSQRIETELAGQPEVQADLEEVMGQVYLKLGLYEKSEALQRQALAHRRAVFGYRHPLVARSLHRVGFALRGQGRWEEASSYLRQALEMQSETLGSDSYELAITFYDLAWIEANKNGKYNAAEDLNRKAVAIFEKQLGYESEEVARGLYNIAWALQRQGRYREAASQYRESLSLWRKLVGDKHRSVAKNMSGLATVYQDMGNFDEAERLHRGALAIRLDILPPDHPDVATSLNNVATVLRDKGDYAGAAEYFEKACTIFRDRLGDRHPYTATCEQNLGSALAGSGRTNEGIALLRRALESREMKVGLNHPETALTLVLLGEALQLNGALEEAELHVRRALRIRIDQLGPDHPETAAAQVRLAEILTNRGSRIQARQLLDAALATQTASLGADSRETVKTRRLLEDLR